MSWQKDERGVGDWWASVIKEFEATHPGVKIEWTKVERGAYADTMTTLFAGGTPPDIVHLASFEFQKFADNGWLEPLDPYIKESKLDLNGWAGQDTCVWKGETVCTMMLYFGYIMAYNEEILKKEGIAVPKTYAEFPGGRPQDRRRTSTATGSSTSSGRAMRPRAAAASTSAR